MIIRRSSITVFVAMFAASTLSACGDQRQDDAQGPGQEASASAGSGLISAQSGFAEMDLASVKAVKSFGLCAVDAINGHGGKDAAKTINLTRAGKVKVSGWAVTPDKRSPRSEEHTSELQSLMRISYAVFCLKKKKIKKRYKSDTAE